LWIAFAMVLAVRIIEWLSRQRLRQTARFVIAFSAAVLFLRLLGILHPSKALVDAVFQAHRFESVLAGRYYFTQPMPGGVQFPYAIGLYVFAAPWSLLTRDHVTLLRIVVCAAECIAGASLYPVIVRTWGDRLAGAVAVALFTVVPISYQVIGNANLTNAFGQSVALLTVGLVVVWSQGPVRARHVITWALLASLALLSHVSTFATLLVTLSALAWLFWWVGGARLRAPAWRVLLATTIAVVFSVVTYYGHFGDVYLKALRVRGGEAPIAARAPAPANETPPTDVAAQGARPAGLGVRTASSLLLVTEAVGWPILLMAGAGAWRVSRRHSRDPLVLALCAWSVAFVVFLAVGLMRVETQFQRYSLEFVGRVAYATYPAAVILAGVGSAWAWRSGRLLRVVSVVLLALAMAAGLREWVQWR
jgi:flagellar biosynthesis protein FliQ